MENTDTVPVLFCALSIPSGKREESVPLLPTHVLVLVRLLSSPVLTQW